MPIRGTDEGRQSSWHLVHFIREPPRLTNEQIEKMKELNPQSPEEIRQQIEEEKFLGGRPVARRVAAIPNPRPLRMDRH